MALTKVSTDGVKDDAITKTKIPANQIEASELADNAVDTNAIANDAVTAAKILDDAVRAEHIADDAVGSAAIADNAVTTSRLAGNAVTTAKIADEAVTLAKLPHGTSSNDGKFLRANNGADPTFETVNTDLVSDTSPQLGADLDVNDFNIKNGTSLVDITENDRIEVDIAGTEIVDINGNGVDVVGNIALTGVGKISTQGSTTQPFTFKNNNRTGTYNQSVMYAHQNNTSGNSSNGIVFEVGRLTDSSSAEIGKFTIATRGGSIATITDADGIKFNGDTAAANALDDYEEGTWTPGVVQGTVSYSGNKYTRIGRLVYVQAYLHGFTNTTSGSTVEITGLPFDGGNKGQAVGATMYAYINNDNRFIIYQDGNNRLLFYGVFSGNYANLTHNQLSGSNANIHLFATYIA